MRAIFVYAAVAVSTFALFQAWNPSGSTLVSPAGVRALAETPAICEALFAKFDTSNGPEFDASIFIGKGLASLGAPLSELLEVQPFVDAITRASQAYEAQGSSDTHLFFSKVLEESGIPISIHGELPVLPADRPVIFVANHPTGALDGMFLMTVATLLRPGTKMVATRASMAIKSMREFLIPVNKSSPKSKDVAERKKEADQIKRENLQAMMQMFKIMKSDGSLALFPSGEISKWDPRTEKLIEFPWNELVGQLVLRGDAIVVPINVTMQNSNLFYRMRRQHSLMMFMEIAHQSGQGNTTSLIVGKPLQKADLPDDPQAIADALRQITQNLSF